ncbi:hypothetical protein [Mesonia oceanica]|uniref:Uncharacterized protein n=1 Tax=Mesonia oceanica TaxID=2687242 RepID=A0AC61Y4B3_9FLAO|nr:hypothetical protein [Mesonia oceanica]VVU99338.1 hypothetical protein FVB9532_00590 [Mesonia oceanica]|tara:strand:+ start:172 stop:567 length:396 start_codon:yes stop_codon:yes gene_type:complete
MGLQEKKTAKAIEDQYLADYQKEINEIVGKEVPVTINWDTFELDFMKFVPSVCLQRLTDAFKEVCADDMGKEAVQETINSVAVYCIPNEGAEEKKELKIADGVFSLTACWGGHHSGYFPDIAIKEYLENNL